MAKNGSPTNAIGWPVESEPLAREFADPVLESLVREDDKGVWVPWLASAWEIAPEKTSITFKLRDGVKFHDGSEWNAEVAKFNIDAYIAAKNSLARGWTSVDIIDPHTIKVNLSSFDNTLLSGRHMTFVSQSAYQKNGIDWIRNNPVGTGPFKFVSYERDVKATYTKFNDYWQKGQPYLDGLEIHIIVDQLTRQMSFETGNLDILGASGKQAQELEAKGYKKEIVEPRGGGATMIPSSNNPNSPLANKKVRMAIEYAIDKEAIAQSMGFGGQFATYQVLQFHQIGEIPGLTYRKYDVAKAKQLLAEGGYPNGFKTKLIPQPINVSKDLMVAIQSQLAAIGIQAELEITEMAKYTEYRSKGWNEGFMVHLMAGFANPNQFFKFYLGGDTWPSMKLPDGYLSLYKESLETSAVDRNKVQTFSKMIWDDCTVIPLSQSTQSTFVVNTHDLGFGKWGDSVVWSPESAWKEAKTGK